MKKKQINHLQAQLILNISHFPSFRVPTVLKNMNICLHKNRNWTTIIEFSQVVRLGHLTTLWHIDMAQGTSSANSAIDKSN